MATRFLLHFAHEHVSFRWAEFSSLAKKNNCKFRLVSTLDHLRSRPYIIVEVENKANSENLVRSAKGSYLLKGLFEIWAYTCSSIEDLAEAASRSPQFLSNEYAKPDQSFRVDCESFGSKLSQTTKVEWIRKMVFLENFHAKPDLSNPKQSYCIFEMNDKIAPKQVLMKEYYFGRLLTRGNREAIKNFSLKERTFIANTSMDPMLSLIASNTAAVKPNDIVYDPFVGSGSLLVAAAYQGAYVLGSDIDWLLLHGKSRPSRKGHTVRQEGECVKANLAQYNLEYRYLDVMVSDITLSPLRKDFTIDSIISDPPYGIRECSEKVGIKKERQVRDYKVRYPSKTYYSIEELLRDLLDLSVKHLTISGRLVYFLPVTKLGCDFEEFIPSHPCLRLLSFCEQNLTNKVSRLLVVMEKTRDPSEGDEVHIPQILNEMNFRETYFSAP